MKNIHEPHLGYVLYPARRDSDPGYSRVDIWLSDTVSGLHFDPRELRLPVADDAGGLSWVTVGHPHYGADRLRVCAGPVDVTGFGGKRRELFTFGGELVVEEGPDATLATLKSEAPVLVQVGPSISSASLMEEAEVVLALRRGVWDEQPGEFDNRLLAADPLELYNAFLTTILARLISLPHGEDEDTQHLIYQLRHEIKWLEEHSQSAFRSIEDIL